MLEKNLTSRTFFDWIFAWISHLGSRKNYFHSVLIQHLIGWPLQELSMYDPKINKYGPSRLSVTLWLFLEYWPKWSTSTLRLSLEYETKCPTLAVDNYVNSTFFVHKSSILKHFYGIFYQLLFLPFQPWHRKLTFFFLLDVDLTFLYYQNT